MSPANGPQAQGTQAWQGCCIAIWDMQNTSTLSRVLGLCVSLFLPQAPLSAQASGTCFQADSHVLPRPGEEDGAEATSKQPESGDAQRSRKSKQARTASMSAVSADGAEDEDGLAKGEDAVVDSLLLLQVCPPYATLMLLCASR